MCACNSYSGCVWGLWVTLSFKIAEGEYRSAHHLSASTHMRAHIHKKGEITWCITSVVVGSEACFNFHYSRKRLVALNGNIMGTDGKRGVAGKQERWLNYTVRKTEVETRKTERDRLVGGGEAEGAEGKTAEISDSYHCYYTTNQTAMLNANWHAFKTFCHF